MIFFYVILLLVGLIFTKSGLFWVYLWQTKEYRLDRFWAEYGHPKKLGKFWLFSGGRKFHQPIHTIKSILIYFFSLAVAELAIFVLLKMFFGGILANFWLLIISLIVLYLLMPLIVSFHVFVFFIPTVIVKRIIYRLAAGKMRKIDNLTVIGITGSYGKSSTKEFLAQILEKKFWVIKTPENINSEIGVAKFVLKNVDTSGHSVLRFCHPEGAQRPKDLTNDDKILRFVQNDKKMIFIVEMGAYKRGEIKRICDIVRPKIGIITGVNEQHLALFGSIENIKKAKFELVESLPDDGLAVFGGDNRYCMEMSESHGGKKAVCHSAGLPFNVSIAYQGGELPRHYLSNIAIAVEVARYLGMKDEEIKEAVASLKLSDRMTKIYSGKNGVLIIEDTYSANLDGVLAALDCLAQQKQKTKIIVMPCLIELGKAAEEAHHRIGKRIGEVCDLAIITTPDYFSIIKKEVGSVVSTSTSLSTSLSNQDKAVLAVEPAKAIEFLKDKLNLDAAVLLEGRLANEIVEFLK
ncbi:MAG: UDP-N-acetylmuramoyl-tripeptide--D-alanyl-D-alanine ligase [Candidatus Portnoybacteria bacterium]|nr:UDP-N-acetylmuramoyl-tripeptide--D-alanyl-D-alanine ligase [Candidatus Portnoybacteria bacterium]